MPRFTDQGDGNYLDTDSADNHVLTQVQLMRLCQSHKNSSAYPVDAEVSALVTDIESVLPDNWEELLEELEPE